MTVSVLIVSYRAYDELSRCLASLEQYCDDDVEVIVADHDTSRAAMDRLRQAYPRVAWLATDDNPGFAAGVNRAARVARGRYLLLLNPDSVLHEDICHPLARWLDAHPAVGIVGALVRDQDGSIQASARRFPGLSTVAGGRSTALTRYWPGNPLSRRNLLTGPQVTAPVAVDWVSGACLMVRRETFDAVGGLDEGYFLYWEDADFCKRAAEAGWTTMYQPAVSVTHLAGRSSAHARGRSLDAFHDSVFRYFRKHAHPVAQVAAPAVWLALRARRAWARARAR